MMHPIISISGKQYVGKDVLADLLIEMLPNFKKSPLAQAIKTEFSDLYHLTPEAIEANKSVYRLGLITLGQRRRLQNPDYWLQKVLAQPGDKIISDMRLRHEYEILRKNGAFLIRLEADRSVRAQRGQISQEDDPTECELDDITGWDARLQNNGSVQQLRDALTHIIPQIQGGGVG